jgi:hypothetical protein
LILIFFNFSFIHSIFSFLFFIFLSIFYFYLSFSLYDQLVWHGVQLALNEHKKLAGGRGDDILFHAQFTAQLQRPGLLRKERVGPRIYEKTILPNSAQLPTEVVFLLDERHTKRHACLLTQALQGV